MDHLWIATLIALGVATGQPALAQTTPSPSATKPSKIDKDDREFMEKAAQLGLAEVEASQLAASKASSQQVRNFAKQMVEDHTKANRELQQIASKKGVKLPTATDDDHQDKLKELKKLSGAKFDEAYMANAGVKDHDRTIDLYEDAQKDVKDPELKAFIARTLPVLKQHHQMAKTVHAAVEKQGSSAVGK